MNQQFKKLNNIVGWLIFAIALTVYAMTAEPTGSLWDCGEFISASHKLQVVHPPGAPLFLMINRMFAVVAETFSSDPQNIAYAINLSSGVCTAFLVLFIFWSTTILARLSLVGRGEIEDNGQIWAILGAGAVAGLSTTFATSVWFSAVEGEVYAMSSFFTGLVVWAGLRWYVSEDSKADRWLVFASYMVGLSIGVHLLSILVAPFVALLYYYKNFTQEEDKRFPWVGTMLAGAAGMGILVLIQYIVIPRIPAMAAGFDFFFVNNLGMGVGMGMLFFVLLLAGLVGGAIAWATKRRMYHAQTWLTSFAMVLIGFSTYGMIVLRANTNIPINMNSPADPYSLLSYLNREQYGDRPLFKGPHYLSPVKRDERTQQPIYEKIRDVYRPVKIGDKVRYAAVDDKMEPVYDAKDMMLFPRLGHTDRSGQYMAWLGHRSQMQADYEKCMRASNGNPAACGALDPNNPDAYKMWAAKNKRPSMGENLSFFFNYQINWMYVRYFMWNFVGRQNAQQGTDGSAAQGNWISGIGFIDAMYTHNQSSMPASMLNDKGRNTYYFLPLIFGLLGMFFHFTQRPKEAFAVLALFILTGVAIIVFLNQPPSEPRERDYAFAGSIFTFCIWIGMAVPLLYATLRSKLQSQLSAIASTALVLVAPLLMGTQNWDDHSRAGHYGARDYATNFLNSCAPNAILFTYGDNDTYPLWYAQEVEGIRTDVRVVNFSLLAVDWYINQLRYKINKSDAIKMTMPEAAYRGKLRQYLIFAQNRTPYNLFDAVKYMSESHPDPRGPESSIPSTVLQAPVDLAAVRKNNALPTSIPDSLVPAMVEFVAASGYWTKDDLALVDIISTNIQNGWERPIYFAVTCRPDKLAPYKDYLQLEGMALRLVPFRSPAPPNAYAAMQLGRVEIDTMYNNIMERFRWGNFDKVETFIDESYRPSVQSVQYSMVRLTDELLRINDTQRAKNVIEKFFTVFPDFNFPYDENRVATQMLMYYYRTGESDKADKIVTTIVNALLEKYRFYMSLNTERERAAFENDLSYNLYLLENMLALVDQSTNAEFKQKIQKEIEAAGIKPRTQPMPPLN